MKNGREGDDIMEEMRIHPKTGEILRRDIRPIEFSYKGEKIFVDIPGLYPNTGDEGIFTHEDMISVENFESAL